MITDAEKSVMAAVDVALGEQQTIATCDVGDLIAVLELLNTYRRTALQLQDQVQTATVKPQSLR
jgi:hypothetical protein